jgi:acetyl-CoA C-acetyltransferase
MTVAANTPVLAGVGQTVDFWNGTDAAAAPSPLSLAVRAGTAALADSGAPETLAAAIDTVFFVRTMADSVPGTPQPFGRCANLPGTLAARLGIAAANAVYSVVGGDQPQALVGEACAMVHAGSARAVLIAGAEATAAFKLAARTGTALDWSDSVDTGFTDRGLGAPLLSGYELTNGLGAPVTTYPAFEHALRARLGLTRAEHLALMSELWAGFSRVAAANPYAQFPVARTAAFLATPSPENYPVADPYLKWHVAQDAVNQGAAVIVTTVGEAARLGIAPDRLVYLHGEARAADRLVTGRADLSRSPAIAGVLARALAAAGRTTAEIAHFDLYSCFPCAVLLAAETLGLDWRTTPATVTGGLPFFGGAGNNYSLHAVATMVERLRSHPNDFGLVLANGGFLSKEAAGIYSAQPREWTPGSSAGGSSAALQAEIDAAPAPPRAAAPCRATIETFTVVAARGVPSRGYVIARNAEGRILARVGGDRLAALAEGDPVGRAVDIADDDGMNVVTAFG